MISTAVERKLHMGVSWLQVPEGTEHAISMLCQIVQDYWYNWSTARYNSIIEEKRIYEGHNGPIAWYGSIMSSKKGIIF